MAFRRLLPVLGTASTAFSTRIICRRLGSIFFINRQILPVIGCRGFSSEAIAKSENKPLPSKEKLLTFDWLLEGLVPSFMKANLQPLFEWFDQEVEFQDQIYGYKAKGISELGVHITKIRIYFRYKSPYNRCAYNGAYLFDNDNFVVLLWGLETMDSNIWNYLPSFLTGKSVKPKIIEGALVFTIGENGKIFKIVNRKIQEKDKELAADFVKLKKEQHEKFDKEDRKAAEKTLKEQLENEKR